MFLEELRLNNFKNYEQQQLTLSPKINYFIGDNGVGKTNILDAIYYLSFCKSAFNAVDHQNIRHGENYFSLQGKYIHADQSSDKVSCQLQKSQKKVIKCNDKSYERLADHIGKFPLVMISPYDRDLINEGSDLRRKFMDGVISQFDHQYLYHLLNYNKALAQRNFLLKKFSEQSYFDPQALEIWSSQMIPLGRKIHERRKAFQKDFLPIFQKYFNLIGNDIEEANITYRSQLNDEGFETLLQQSLAKDKGVRYTSVGIHKDDLMFSINGYPFKKFGSQGQQKSFVIAIRLAQFAYIKKMLNYNPILLFDDIFDKLDSKRVERLMNLVSDNEFGQVFITDTQLNRINLLFESNKINHKIFYINNGSVEKEDIHVF